MKQISSIIGAAWWNLTNRVGLIDVVDIILMAVIIYELLLLVRQTRSSAVLTGLFFLVVASFVSSFFGLTSLNWLLTTVLANGALVLVVLFQPEFRKALEQIGRGAFFTSTHEVAENEAQRIIEELTQCMMDLSRRKVGLLVVFERKIGLADVIETGTRVDGRISAPLLENIFEPNTPLHDGAVIIRGNQVLAAACILPLTESRDVSRELGTRHRAAIGISESTDAIAIVVSEETGKISMTQGGKITRGMDEGALKVVLGSLFINRRHGFLSDLRRFSKKEDK